MNLARFLKEERVDLHLDEAFPARLDDDGEPVPVAGEALAEHMAGLLERSEQIGNPRKMCNDLVNREKQASSLLGEGFALPHVRTMQAKRLVMAVGVSREGLVMDTPDDEPVHLVVALVGPPYDDKTYLQVYKRLSEAMLQDGWVDGVLGATEPGEVVRALSR